MTEDFAYGDRGRVEFVVSDPTHIEFEIRFAAVSKRPLPQPQAFTPAIGTGDLLRYNRGIPTPITFIPFNGTARRNR